MADESLTPTQRFCPGCGWDIVCCDCGLQDEIRGTPSMSPALAEAWGNWAERITEQIGDE